MGCGLLILPYCCVSRVCDNDLHHSGINLGTGSTKRLKDGSSRFYTNTADAKQATAGGLDVHARTHCPYF
jgi:hypothetical protein